MKNPERVLHIPRGEFRRAKPASTHAMKKASVLSYLLNLLFSFQRPTFPATEATTYAVIPAAGSGILGIGADLSTNKIVADTLFCAAG
jgi:hypothetical protein